MINKRNYGFFVSALTGFLIALAGLGGGCTAPPTSSSAPKPGQGIAEYRQVVREAYRSVGASMEALASLSIPMTQTSVPPAALARFDKTFAQLELTSVKARSRAEAIIARGQAYFDEWKENLSSVTNQAAAISENDRFQRLQEHFVTVRQCSSEVREEFRPFMAGLREFRAQLGRTPSTGRQGQIDTLVAGGRRVLQTLRAVTTALDDAETEVQKVRATKS